MKPLPISEPVPVAEHRTAEIRHVKAWRCSARKPEAGQPMVGPPIMPRGATMSGDGPKAGMMGPAPNGISGPPRGIPPQMVGAERAHEVTPCIR
jgi:hypothetical protein